MTKLLSILLVALVVVNGFEVQENPSFDQFSEDVKPFNKAVEKGVSLDHDRFTKMLKYVEDKGLFSPFNPNGGYGDQVESCEDECLAPITWDEPEYFCTTEGETLQNLMCPRGNTKVACLEELNPRFQGEPTVGIASPGACGCPNDCMGNGRCHETCKCDDGYKGKDCSVLKCKDQSCNGRGKCHEFSEGFSACKCDDGYGLNDCSAEISPLPPLPNLLDKKQYSNDQFGDDHPIFNMSAIMQIYVDMHKKDLEALILPENQQAREYKKANITFYNGPERAHFVDAGIRIKGGASRAFAKKSFKISLTHFNKDNGHWYGQKHFSLKAASMVPDFVREMTSAGVVHSMGAPVQRISYSTVNINEESRGVYLLMEDPTDPTFLKSRFGYSDGSLWKCTGTLNYLGSDPELYREHESPTLFSGKSYRPETSGAQDFGPLANFIYVLTQTPDRNFETEIEKVFNVEFFMRTYAAEVITANFDGIWNGNNYFLYLHEDGRIHYYRQDLDLSIGSLPFLQMDHMNIWEWGSYGRGGRILPTRLMQFEKYQKLFAHYLASSMEFVNAEQHGDFLERVYSLQSTIAPAVKNDYWHRLDLAYSYNEFVYSVDRRIYRPLSLPPNDYFDLSVETVQPIRDFLVKRGETARKQLEEGPNGTGEGVEKEDEVVEWLEGLVAGEEVRKLENAEVEGVGEVEKVEEVEEVKEVEPVKVKEGVMADVAGVLGMEVVGEEVEGVPGVGEVGESEGLKMKWNERAVEKEREVEEKSGIVVVVTQPSSSHLFHLFFPLVVLFCSAGVLLMVAKKREREGEEGVPLLGEKMV